MVVPCEGIVFAQVVESDLISRWNVLHPVRLDDAVGDADVLKVDAKSNSSSSLALHDLQLSQVSGSQTFTAASLVLRQNKLGCLSLLIFFYLKLGLKADLDFLFCNKLVHLSKYNKIYILIKRTSLI